MGASAASGWWRLRRLEIHLGHAVGAAQGVASVQEHRRLHGVAGGEREPLEQLAAGGHLAGERLGEARQVGEELTAAAGR